MPKKKTKTEKKIEKSKKPDEFEFRCEAKYLKELCKVVRVISDNALMNVDPAGIEVKMVDPKGTFASTIVLGASALQSKVKMKKDSVQVGLDFKKLDQFMTNVKEKKMVDVVLEDGNFMVTGESLKKTIQVMSRKPKSHRTKEVNPPFEHEFELKADELKATVKHAKKCISTDEIIFEAGPGFLFIKAVDRSTEDDIILKFGEGDMDRKELDKYDKDDRVVSSKFGMELIDPVIKVMKDKDKVTINTGDCLPVEFMWSPVEDMNVQFMIAPRVDSD